MAKNPMANKWKSNLLVAIETEIVVLEEAEEATKIEGIEGIGLEAEIKDLGDASIVAKRGILLGSALNVIVHLCSQAAKGLQQG